MTNDGLVLLGQLARRRRDRLGLNQGDLVQYGGPRVSTVGKIERAEQDNYPLRTRHQLENALGWARGTVDGILAAPAEPWWDDAGMREDFITSVIEDHIPDLANPVARPAHIRYAASLTDDELLAELTYRMKAYAKESHYGDGAAMVQAAARATRRVTDEEVEDLVQVLVVADQQREQDPQGRRQA